MHKKILVVDDQQDMLFMMKSILLRNGFDVVTNSDGEIFNLIKEGMNPDLIILDINLGGKDGGEICHSLKTKESTKHIPVILISAIMDLTKISEECGAEDYLAKPFREPQLMDKVFARLNAA